jgi:hypothetical protein
MRTDTRVFLLKVVRTDRMSALHITRPLGRLGVPDPTLLSAEIRPTCSMQDLIVKEIGGRLSFFTLRGQLRGFES